MSRFSRWKQTGFCGAAAALIVGGVAVVVPGAAPIAQAGGSPDLQLTKDMPEDVLFGEPVAVTLSASTTEPAGGTNAFNLTFSDKLPPGATFGSSDPAPTTITADPTGDVVIWENVSDAIAGTTVTLDYTFNTPDASFDIGDTITNTANAYASLNARQIPDIDPLTGLATATGVGTDASSFFEGAQDSTLLIPFRLTKDEPSEEAELLRGVHDHKTVYTLTVDNNLVVDSQAFGIVDYLPAGIEFLGCTAQDNTAAGVVEYPATGSADAAGRIDATPHPPLPEGCPTPTSVTTVEIDPDGPGADNPMPFDVYTRIEWSAADLSQNLAPGGQFIIQYAAGIPLKENVVDGVVGVTTPATANLDNNTGDLTTDEQLLQNFAEAFGTTGGTAYSDDDIHDTVAEDVSIHKTVGVENFDQSTDGVVWRLFVESSEYAVDLDSVIVVEDFIPNGVTYVSSTINGNPATLDEGPENLADGRQRVQWDLPPFTSQNSEATILLTTDTLNDYRAPLTGPVAASDSWTNTVELNTTATLITDHDGTLTSDLPIPDESEAGQEAGTVTILKEVSEPIGNNTLTCGDGSGIAFDPVLGDFYRPGDRVCWRLTVNFPGQLDTLTPQVIDFLPEGFTFESEQLGEFDGFGAETTFTNNDPQLVWDLRRADNTDNPDIPLDPDQQQPGDKQFQVVVSTIIDDPDALDDVDLSSNLMKFSFSNTAGAVFQLRDQADALFRKPILGITKAADVATAVGGDSINYTVTVTNTGTLDAINASVRDVLPAGVDCTDVAVPAGASCTDDGAESYLQWDGLTVAADGGTQVLTYAIVVPGTFNPGEELVNNVGVRFFENPTNSGNGNYQFRPDPNIDSSLVDLNADPVSASAVVTIDGALLGKELESGVAEQGNGNGQATIGETVTYFIDIVIPEGTTTVNARIDDVLPEGLRLDSVAITSPTGSNTAGIDTIVGPASPPTNGDIPAGGFRVDFPTYVNAPGSGADVFRATVVTTVLNDAANTVGLARQNNAFLRWARGFDNDQAGFSIVEPNIAVTKTSDDADGVVDPGQEPLTYTVTVTNSGSVAHDVVVIDTVPTDITPIDGDGNPLQTGDTVDGAGVFSAGPGPRTITWTLDQVTSLDTFTFVYPTEVANPLTGGSSLNNTVTATATSLDGGVPDERTNATSNGSDRYTDSATNELVGPNITIAKSASDSTLTIGETVTYTLDVVVPTGVVGFDITVLDDLPTGVEYLGNLTSVCAAGDNVCDPDLVFSELSAAGDTGTVGFFLGDITGEPQTRAITVTYDAVVVSGSNNDVLTNTATGYLNSTNQLDDPPATFPTPAEFSEATDPPSTADVTVVEPLLVLDKNVDLEGATDDERRAKPGDKLTYEITVTNNGTSPAYNVTVTDEIDPRLTDYIDMATGGTPVDADPADGTLSWAIPGPLAPGESVTITYMAMIPDTLDEADEVVGFELVDTADVPSYQGVATADQVPGRTYETYDNVDADTVSVELDLASIGDRVWLDRNNDGVQDADEPGLNGVTVTVTYHGPDGDLGTADDEVFTVDTAAGAAIDPAAADGQYLVDELPGGTYTVTVDTDDLPAGLSNTYDLDGGIATPNDTWTGTLGEDEAKRDVDFGYNGGGSIGDRIFFDQNTNGTQDGVEPGVAGVRVVVTWAGPNGIPGDADDVEYEDTTDANGDYLIEDLPLGSYTVDVDESTLPTGSSVVSDPDADGVATPDGTSTTELTAAEPDDDTQDFGVAGLGSIGDTVYLDRNGDGDQDPVPGDDAVDEKGIPGVTVGLFEAGPDGTLGTADDVPLGTDVTDENGNYSFDNLPDGDYRVTINGPLPAGLTPTEDPDGGADQFADVTLGGAEPINNPDQDFGFEPSSRIGDRVWLDNNSNGVQDDGEPGLNGVEVTVTYVGPDGAETPNGNEITFVTTTSGDGDYIVEDIPDGTYIVEVTGGVPAGLSPTFDDDGPPPGGGPLDERSVTTVTDEDLDQDFGYDGEGSIGDTIFFDQNADGTQDDPAEYGVEGVRVVVTFLGADGAPGGGDDIVFEATTNEDGEYLVEGLPLGDYTVEVDQSTLPEGFTPVSDPDDDGTATPDGASTTTLDAANPDDLDQDFGVAGEGTIGDTIYLDRDGNGTQDDPTDDPGLAGVTVTLTDAGPDGALDTADDVEFTDVTDGSGNYLFENLPSGDYRVTVDTDDLPDAVTPTEDSDGGADSTSEATLDAANPDDLDQDFGYDPNSRLGDRVWWDQDKDGVQDADEPGLNGVTVRAVYLGADDTFGTADDLTFTTETAGNGDYIVEDIPDGRYVVSVIAGVPAGFGGTYDDNTPADGTTTVGSGTSTLLSANPLVAENLDQDFGYAGNSSIGDRIFLDQNADGIQTGPPGNAEPGLEGVTVTVIYAGADGVLGTPDDIAFPTVTDENGDYTVDGLPAGVYRVVVDESTLPDGVSVTSDVDGLVDPSSTVDVPLGANEDRDDVDFGYTGTSSIGDTIFWDRNEDGVDGADDGATDGEPGLEGVTVTVTDLGDDGVLDDSADPNGDDTVYTRVTDENGEYLVDGLPAGDYLVEVDETTLPDGMRNTVDEDGGIATPDSSTPVTLGEDDDHLTADFGYVGDATIGDTVYLDLDGNGEQDPATEPGVPDQTVTLTWEGEDGILGTVDDVVLTTTTDPDGTYTFEGLPDGDYTVTVDGGIADTAANTDDPDEGTPGDLPNESDVTIVGGADDLDQDFGYQGDNSLGDTIWFDVNRDGVQGDPGPGDDAEPRLAGVDVIVTWYGPDRAQGGGDDVVYPAVTTNDDGEYLVEGLPDGRFEVDVDESTLPGTFDNTFDPQGLADSGNPGAADGISTVQLGTNDAGDPIGNTNLDQDFGYAGTGSIGDTIYLDRNGDGAQGDPADEPGIEGVTVTLVLDDPDGDDDITVTTTTDENGNYTFDELPDGDYTVTVGGALPANVGNTDDPDAAPGAAGDSMAAVTLGFDPDGTVENTDEQDFGYDADSVLGDRVWFDANRDGVQDDPADEPGINGVEITVTYLGADGVPGGGDDLTFVTTTDGDGDWMVTDIPDGNYVVEVTDGVPAGFGPTFDSDSPADGTIAAGDDTSAVALTTEDLEQDFGYAGDSSIGDQVWLDLDGNGVLDGEEVGLAGVAVTVTWLGPDGAPGGGDDVEFTTVTEPDGTYLVEGLPAGEYTVEVDDTTLPDGVEASFDRDDTPDGTTAVTLPAATDLDDVDFGYQGTSSIGDTIFLDRNNDGVDGPDTGDDAEPGIEGVTVTLTAAGPDGALNTADDVTFTDTTDENGEYLFDGLPAGNYIVTVDETTLPDGVTNTVDEDGGLGAGDSTTPVTLGDDDDHLTADFGYVGPGEIGDTVYLDLNGNGTQDPGEPGVPNQEMTLTTGGEDGLLATFDDNETFTTTTDENGDYEFVGLPLGEHSVNVTDGISDVAENTGDPDEATNPGTPDEAVVTLTVDEPVDEDQDFGYQGLNSLGDTVFWDTNGDGVDDGAGPEVSEEPRLAGVDVVVTYFGPDDVEGTDDDIVLTDTTDVDGIYGLDGLPNGMFSVAVDQDDIIDGLEPTVDADDGTTNPDAVSVTTLDGGRRNDLDQDFGFGSDGSIEGGLFLDRDGDETQDQFGEEPGLEGITIKLITAGPDGVLGNADDVTIETLTDENGEYSFTGLPAGDFIVMVDDTTLPPGVTPTLDPEGDDDNMSPVTLGTDPDGTVENIDDVDFGYQGAGSIGDTVYLDVDGDGVQADDGSEPGVPDQTVNLSWAGEDGTFGTDDDETFETATDANGEYLFDGLPDGDYVVVVEGGIADAALNTGDPDEATNPGTPNESAVTLDDTNRNNEDQDFGYQGLNTIGDTVFWDINGNGIDDGADPAGGAEPRLDGVDVTLTWFGPDGDEGTADDVVLPIDTTDADGLYLFENLPDGEYRVSVDQTDVPAGLAPTVDDDDNSNGGLFGPDGTSITEVGPAAREDLDQDFGFGSDGSIEGTLFLDADANEEQNDEAGLAGVTVKLLTPGPDGEFGTADDVTLQTVETGLDGSYAFNGLPEGEYLVMVDDATLPSGVSATIDPDGADDGMTPITLGTDPDGTVDNVTDADFGYVGEGTIGDTVYLDLDGNGTQDPATEPGVPNQPVMLVFLGDDGVVSADDIMFITTTDENGNYLFEGLPDGDFIVSVVGGITDVAENTGDPDEATDPGTPNQSAVTLADGAREDLDQDFGYQGDNSLGDTVYQDTAGDGVDDGAATDPRLDGVDVVVTYFGPDGVEGTDDDITFTDTTDVDGIYGVDGLPDGTYSVAPDAADVPVGLSPSVDPDDGTDNPDGTSEVTLADGVPNLDQDFGYTAGGSIAGELFLDRDEDESQGDDGDEPGLEGITVKLLTPGPDGEFGTADDVTAATTDTDDNGAYNFPGLPAGDYLVMVDDTTLPSGVSATVDPDGTDDGMTPITLTEDADGTVDQVDGVDFGYVGDGTIGDTVYLDLDGNGVQDDGEPGVVGQPVTLTWAGEDGVAGTDDDEVFETTTDDNGNYLFDGLPDGDYTVTVDGGIADAAENTGDPDEATDPGTPNQSAVTLADGAREDLDQDFGYQGDNALGDTVFNDQNGNGVDDGAATDTRVEGVDVIVTWFGLDGVEGTDDDVEFPAATTDADGTYAVDGLPDGTFSVELDPATLPDGLDPSVDPDSTPGEAVDGQSIVELRDGETNDEQDFGLGDGGSITGPIFFDLDGDGIQDPDEPGLGGVTVTLTGPDGLELTTVTDPDGNYEFFGLPEGDFTVTVDPDTLPDGMKNTADPDGDNDFATDVTLTTGPDGQVDDIADVAFGANGDFTIGSTVYFDTNGDGVQDVGPDSAEPGIPGQTVTLTWEGEDGVLGTPDDETFTTVTDESGNYAFENLPNGDYQVTVVDGIADAADNTGDPDGAVPNESQVTIADADELEENFGYLGDNAVGDTIFNDVDTDGVDDGRDTEPGLPGVEVTVTWLGADGVPGGGDDVVFPTETTDENGQYSVDGLPDGNVLIEVDPATVPGGLQPTVDSDGGIDGGDNQSIVTVADGETNNDQDFGYGGAGRVGDNVFLDLDGDGVKDLGEPGIEGATVTLVFLGADGIAGTPDDQTFTTTTDDMGNYLFEGLPAGDFTVTVSGLPDGVTPTFDADGGNDLTSAFTLEPNGENLDQDFGVRGDAAVGDTIFLDTDDNGAAGPLEPRIEGVTVTVTSAGVDGVLGTDDDIVITATTDDAGEYFVDGIPAGPTQVSYDTSDLATPLGPISDLDGGEGPDAATTTVDLVANEPNRDVDFAVGGDAGLTGTFFNDLDGDGVQDPGEEGIAGATVLVTWLSPDGPVMIPVVTDADGKYSLANLPAGDYVVDLDRSTVPDGLAVSSLLPVTLNIPAGVIANLELPATPEGSVTGKVLNDTDRDGRVDPGEPGIPNVTVQVLDPNGNVVGSTTTDSGGNYEVDGLPPGTYTVVVVDSTIPDGLEVSIDGDGLKDGRTTVVVGTGDDVTVPTFGYAPDGPTIIPRTGSEVIRMLLVAMALVLIGAFLVMARRRPDEQFVA